jgi:hypothetical protein
MIDTIAIILDQSKFAIFDPEKFHPSAREIMTRKVEMRKATQNPTKKQLKAGNYLPRLTLFKRPSRNGRYPEVTLKIEFSIPKMIFSNNFDELEESDFEQVVVILKEKLAQMGIQAYSLGIENALVSLVHYGKNFVLTDYSTPYSYIQEIRKADISRVYDTNQTDFRNEGHSFKYRSNSFEIVFYDKIKDLEKAKISPKRSEESEDVAIQLNLFDVLKPQSKKEPFEVLRMEIRLNNRRKIRAELKRLGFDLEPTFINLFSKNIAQQVCLKYLHDIKPKLIFSVVSSSQSFTTQLSELIAKNPQEKSEFLFQYLAFAQVINEHDLRTARQLIDPANSGKWYRLKKKFENIKHPDQSFQIDKLVKIINEFKPVKLVDYHQLMLNNDKNETNR